MGRLLRQHRVWVRGQPPIRRYRGTGQVPQGEDQPAQQRGRQIGKSLSSVRKPQQRTIRRVYLLKSKC